MSSQLWVPEKSFRKESHLAANANPFESDGHVVHVEDELAQVAEQKAEDDEDLGSILQQPFSAIFGNFREKNCHFLTTKVMMQFLQSFKSKTHFFANLKDF
jgi:hypothetical protein